MYQFKSNRISLHKNLMALNKINIHLVLYKYLYNVYNFFVIALYLFEQYNIIKNLKAANYFCAFQVFKIYKIQIR